MNKLIIFGADGQLGKFLSTSLQIPGYEVVGYTYLDADITNKQQLESKINEGDLVVNCAAYTNTVKCETDDLCHKVNADAVELMAQICKNKNAKLIHISSNYVYTPSLEGKNWKEDEIDNVIPGGKYGLTKLEGDRAIIKVGGDYLIIRVSWLHSMGMQNFCSKMLSLGRDELSIAVDDKSNLTTGSMVKRFIESGYKLNGTYNVCTDEVVSRNELFKTFLEVSNKKIKVNEAYSKDFGFDISKISGLYMDNSKAKDIIKIHPIKEELEIWWKNEKGIE